MIGHESFLLGRAQPDPKEIWLQTCNFFLQPKELRCGRWTKRGRAGAHDLDAWKIRQENVSEFLGDPGRAAVQEMGVALLRGAPTDFPHEVRSEDALNAFKSLELSHPDGGHAIGHCEHRLVKN